MIDAHIHLWDIERLDYPWLGQVPSINRSFLIADYDAAIGGEAVDAMVFVQCECRRDQHLDELAWVQSIADADPRLRAIIPWAPLEDGGAVAQELAQIAEDPRVKGVRRIIEFEEDIDFCARPGFVRGVQLLGEVGLHCELTIGPRNFPNVIKLVEACPDTRFILDHIGCPNIAAGEIEPWRTHLRNFASSGPHACKFSNLVCNADLERWTADDLRPFAETVFEAFGEDRILWASDWPHCLRASSWRRWFDTAVALTGPLGPGARRKIFHTNAKSFYRI
jgi:L-fuconolactonase